MMNDETDNTCQECGNELIKDEVGTLYCPTCGVEFGDPDSDGDNMTDVEADADTLASAGYGTDEDYGYYGGNEE